MSELPRVCEEGPPCFISTCASRAEVGRARLPEDQAEPSHQDLAYPGPAVGLVGIRRNGYSPQCLSCHQRIEAGTVIEAEIRRLVAYKNGRVGPDGAVPVRADCHLQATAMSEQRRWSAI
jgi:hypothetical protein